MAEPSAPLRDQWTALRELTPARVALGRAGTALPTDASLHLSLAHARARDAVHAGFDPQQVAESLARLGLPSLIVHSRASSRDVYLRRPDLGRQLCDDDVEALRAYELCDVAIVIGDGLSPLAATTQGVDLAAALLAHPSMRPFTCAPIVVAAGARVALGDAIGEALRARLIIMLVGERPGMSTPDSLGIYVTYEPRIGRLDAERNCISNVHGKGLSIAAARDRLMWLVGEAFSRGLTGVALKDESALSTHVPLPDR
jgi:ethanolamine ammonia-lyase small subunit